MASRRPRSPAPTGEPDEFRPGAVRVLAVVWWAFAGYLVLDLVLRGQPGQLVLGLPLLLLSAVAVHALFWYPAVRVDADGVELVNVLRTVRIPWASVEDTDTRWALSLLAAGRRWTAWAAPSSGRRLRPVQRRDAPWLPRDADSVAGSRAPGSSAGEAAVLVETRWQTWKDRPRSAPAAGGPGAARAGGPTGLPQVRWNARVVAALVGAAALVVLGALAVAL